MLREFEKPNLFDWGLDIIFNLAINLGSVHLPHHEYYKDSNRSYITMKDVQWKIPSASCISVLCDIKDKFIDKISHYMNRKYGEIVLNSEKAQKVRSSKMIEVVLNSKQENKESIIVKVK